MADDLRKQAIDVLARHLVWRMLRVDAASHAAALWPDLGPGACAAIENRATQIAYAQRCGIDHVDAALDYLTREQT